MKHSLNDSDSTETALFAGRKLNIQLTDPAVGSDLE